QVQQIRVVLDVARMLREPLAAEVGFGQASVLKEHAPRAVEDEDPLGCELADAGGGIAHKLFRRLVTRSPSCFSKLSGAVSVPRDAYRSSLGRRRRPKDVSF